MARLAALTAAALLLGVACETGPSKVIKIGVDLPLGGAEGRAATPALNGVSFFVEQHPVLDGFTIVVDARDDSAGGAGNPDRGVANVKALSGDSVVMAVIGPFDSSVARAVIPIANAGSLAIISPAATSRCLTKEPYLPAGLNPLRTAISCADVGLPSPKDLRPSGTNNFFRLATTDDLQGPAAADHAYTTLNLRRVAVLSDHEAYGQALAAAFRARFTRLGGLVVKSLDFNPSASADLAGFLTLARKDGAQAIYFGGTTAAHGCAVRAQMASTFGAGDTAPYFGGDGIAQDPACIRDAGANAAGIYVTVPGVNADAVPAAAPTIAAFKRRYPRAVDYGAYTIPAYDATGVLYAALHRAIQSTAGKLPTRSSVVGELAATKSYSGASGTFGFDADGDTTSRLVSIYRSPGQDPARSWPWVRFIDYSTALPY
jgi:branched-chain amino acid transport system substrate-binding protein